MRSSALKKEKHVPGRFGLYGGRYVPETLMAALEQLEREYDKAKRDKKDYTPADELPYVGPILPGNDKIFVATGFDKWGMTNGTAAALALSSRILGGRMDWA